MADEETENLLTQWNFENLIPQFKDNEITINRFKGLRKELINELIPKIGPRIDFIEKWEKEFSSAKIQRPDTPSEANTNGTNGAADTQPSTNGDADVQENQKDRQLDQSNDLDQLDQSNHLDRSYSAESNYHRHRKDGQSNYLKDLLARSNYGQPLITEYKRHSGLSEKSSLLLCEIITSDLITDVHSFLTLADYTDLTAEILVIFPNENPHTYFIPPKLKRQSIGGKGERARGRLVDKFHNNLQRYRVMCGYSKKSRDTASKATPVLTEDVERSLHWLDHNRDEKEIEPHWRKTARTRLDTLTATFGTVSDYFKKYPVLTDAKIGWKLIDIDFDELFESQAGELFVAWGPFFEKLVAVRKINKVKGTFATLLELISDDEIDQHAKEFIQIMLLAYLVPPRSGTIVKGGTSWKPSAEESARGFAVHVKVPGDIEDVHVRKVNTMYDYGLTVQPYIIGVGNTLKTVNQFYVVIDKVRYHFDSPVKALDVCFKSFFTCNAEFPRESEQIWILLQHGLYRCKTDTDKVKPHVAKILQQMNAK